MIIILVWTAHYYLWRVGLFSSLMNNLIIETLHFWTFTFILSAQTPLLRLKFNQLRTMEHWTFTFLKSLWLITAVHNKILKYIIVSVQILANVDDHNHIFINNKVTYQIDVTKYNDPFPHWDAKTALFNFWHFRPGHLGKSAPPHRDLHIITPSHHQHWAPLVVDWQTDW